MEALDFTSYPAGIEYEGRVLETCPICGKVGLPGRRRQDATSIHKAVLVRGALNITAFCTLTARGRKVLDG